MGRVAQIDDYRPHIAALTECYKCGKEWVAVYLVGTESLECPECHNAVKALSAEEAPT